MTDEQRQSVVQLMREEIDPSCYYDNRSDFVIFRSRVNGTYRQMIIKEKSPWIILYGGNYKEMRALFMAYLKSIESSEYDVDVPQNEVEDTDAVWCRIKFRFGKDWFAHRDRIIAVAKALKDQVGEWGVLGNVSRATNKEKNPDGSTKNQGVSKNGGKLWKDETHASIKCRNGKRENGTKVFGKDNSMIPTPSDQMPAPREVAECTNDFWRNFYIGWNDFLAEWDEAPEMPRNPVALAFLDSRVFVKDELPEPYYGFPHEGVGAVMLNINPGKSAHGFIEDQKFRGEGNRLYDYFKNTNANYYEYQKKYSSLYEKLKDKNGTVGEVCGCAWWHGGRSFQRKKPFPGRMPWLKRIYTNDELSSNNVFALELCPFHSKEADFDINAIWERNDDIKMHLVKGVFEPAMVAVSDNQLPFAVAIGADIRNVLERLILRPLNNLEVEFLSEWVCGKDRVVKYNGKVNNELLKIWPRYTTGKNKEKYKVREYKLYKIRNAQTYGLILVTSASGGNTPPAEDFQDVEEIIRNFANTCR